MNFQQLNASKRSDKCYRGHIKELAEGDYWPQCRWLEWFFRHPGSSEGTFVNILDSVQGEFKIQIFIPPKDVLAEPSEFGSALSSHPLDIGTRVIVFEHGRWEDVHRGLLDTLCAAYDLEPLFVMSHFYWDHWAHPNKTFKKSPRVCPPVSLPSLVSFLSLDFRGQFSGLLLPNVSPPTVIIFAASRLWDDSDKASHRKEVQRYCYGRPVKVAHVSQYRWPLLPLLHLNSTEILAADRNIIEYLHPYAQFLATAFTAEMSSIEKKVQKLCHTWPQTDEEDEDTVVEHALVDIHPHIVHFSEIRISLDRCYHHLSQFIEKQAASPKMINLVRDYQTLARHAEEFERNSRLFTQLWIGLADVEEARESRREATQVRLLTNLAFIFIPLDFINSFFGMNFDALTGTSSTIRFSITAGVMITVLMLSFFIILRVSNTRRDRAKWSEPLQHLSKAFFFPFKQEVLE